MNRLRRTVLVALTMLLLVPASAAAYAPLTAPQIISKLNAFRAAHGFPGAVTNDASLSAGCTAHNRWMQANGRLQHEQIPGTRFASAAGAEAGMSSVLAQGATWRDGNPWLNAPVHLADTLIPGMVQTGASEQHGRNCLYTHTGDNLNPTHPDVATVYSYPNEGGSAPHYQIVEEAPAPPQVYGPSPIRAGTATGPHIIVFLYGPIQASTYAHMTAAALTGPGGATVPLKWHSEKTLSSLPPHAGLLIPRTPLRVGATYTYTTTWTGDEETYVTPARTFTATSAKLCGTGVGGWANGVGCPGGNTGGSSGGTKKPAKAPAVPKASQVKLVGKAPKLAAFAAKGNVKVKLPVKAAKVKVVGQLTVTATQARALGLKVRKGQKHVAIGSGQVTSKQAGSVTLTVKLTKAAKAKIAKAGKQSSKVRRVKTSLKLTLRSGAKQAKPVSKAFTFKK